MAGTGPIAQDWEPVVLRKKAPTAAAKKDEKAVNAARRSGAEIETVKKSNAGTNKAASSGTSLNTRKLDEETENLSHGRVSTELKKNIMQARLGKKLTQVQLAQITFGKRRKAKRTNAMAAVAAATSCLILPCKLKPCPSSLLVTNRSAGTPISRSKCPFAFSSALSLAAFPPGLLSAVEKRRAPLPGRPTVVCEAVPKKYDSAAKRARQAEKLRIYNKARKSEIRTRMKKVLESLNELRKKSDAQSEDLLPIEKLIAEAFSVIDKAVKVGTLHRNTGARRKSRLSRWKKAVEIHHGWYEPVAAS